MLGEHVQFNAAIIRFIFWEVFTRFDPPPWSEAVPLEQKDGPTSTATGPAEGRETSHAQLSLSGSGLSPVSTFRRSCFSGRALFFRCSPGSATTTTADAGRKSWPLMLGRFVYQCGVYESFMAGSSKQVMDMGFDEASAKRALSTTGLGLRSVGPLCFLKDDRSEIVT